MKVLHEHGLSNQFDPESRAGPREGAGEALTGGNSGPPLNSESIFVCVATWSCPERRPAVGCCGGVGRLAPSAGSVVLATSTRIDMIGDTPQESQPELHRGNHANHLDQLEMDVLATAARDIGLDHTVVRSR